MPLQSLIIKTAVFRWENNEGDDSDVTAARLEELVKSCKSLNEKISTFVTELVTAGSEEEQSFLEVEVDVPVEMTVDEVEYLLFVLLVKVLKNNFLI